MKENKGKLFGWREFVDGLYTRSDLATLLDQPRASECGDFEEVSKQLWVESESYNIFSIKELIENQQVAFQLIECQKNKKRIKRARIFKRWGSAAASVLLCLSCYFLFQLYSENQKLNSLCKIDVPYGMKLNGTLPDGTKIVLNSGSSLIYPKEFGSDVRNIEFSGEGFFDVAKNENCPFVIHSKGVDVKVLGTSFNFNNYTENDMLSLTLCTGKVLMSYEEERISLRPGEQLVLSKESNGLERTQVNARNSTSWIQGKFYFNKTPIREAARAIERYYNCSILLDPQSKFANKLSGTHDNKSLESVLQSIELATGIKYKYENGHYTLYK